MKFNAKILITLVAMLITVSMLSIWIRWSNGIDKVDNTQDVKGVVDYSTYPSIQNIPPNSVYVGQAYIYDLAVIDSDTHYANITLEIIEGPKWLVTNGLSLIGTPSIYDVGEHKVTIKLNDGTNSVFNNFYIVVLNPNENN